MSTALDPQDFISILTPVLERRDLNELLALVRARFSPEQLISLLACRCCDARKVAALSLGLVGEPDSLPGLVRQLRDDDPMVNQMAEHAIWSIWFRGGCEEANKLLCRGAKALEHGDFVHAIEQFDRALKLSPGFSEAFNQRALAKYMLEDFSAALRDCRQVVKLTPFHFGAWAGMGHCHANLEQFRDAAVCYQKALKINPHMREIREVLEALQKRKDLAAS